MKYSGEKKHVHCHTVYQKSHTDWPKIEPESVRYVMAWFVSLLDVHESVHRDTTMKITNKLHYTD
jgi:hypothetical protein